VYIYRHIYIQTHRLSITSNSSQSSASINTLPNDHWHRMAIHWQYSGNYVKAMASYHNSSILLEDLGSYKDSRTHLFKAYEMLDLLRTEAEVPKRPETEEIGDPHKHVLNFYRKLSERFVADNNPYLKKKTGNDRELFTIQTREETYTILKVGGLF
jgi:hypothetical protein